MIATEEKRDKVIKMGMNSNPMVVGQAYGEMFTTDIRPLMGNIQTPVLVLGSWAAYQNFGATKESVTYGYQNQLKDIRNVHLLVAEEAYVSRLSVSPNRLVRNIRTDAQFTGTWNVQAQTTFSVTFQSANEARWFFNTGGKILLQSARTGGSLTPQNGNWSGLLNAVGEVEFGSQTPTFMNFYGLTDEYQVVLQNAGSGAFAYVGNFFVIKAKSNVANNNDGGATIIEFEITWVDTYPEGTGYTPEFGDRVDGTLTLSVSELKASGSRIPIGVFTVASPTYSQPIITAS
jgi:hypothetical protein